MCYSCSMSDIERLKMLTSQMHLEPAEDCHQAPLPERGRKTITVKEAIMPNGRSIKLLKTLLNSYCEQNCRYCPFRAQRDIPRAVFTPDEFASLFISLHQTGLVEGIFLSSSIFGGAIRTQDLLLDTAAILRNQYQYKGYLHLKIMPGAEEAQVEQAMLLADRLSVNLEAPHSDALEILAPQKNLHTDLLDPLTWIQKIRTSRSPSASWSGKWPSSSTQFVVGAAGETDLDILSTTAHLHRHSGITRAYYSSFTPIQGTPLENLPPSSPKREFRLYQAFYLLRDYGYSLEDLPYQETGNLPLEEDPKTAWAKANILPEPLEINTAPRSSLLRIPGIGPIRANKILHFRHKAKLKTFSQLRKMNLVSENSAPYILIGGKSPALQLNLF